MKALLNLVEQLLKMVGLLLFMLVIAWSLVTLGILADSRYLLHVEKADSSGRKKGGLHLVKRPASEQQNKEAA